ncbi:MAG: hypothetical protein LBL45_10725 [Treponema sp.]|nr:hypothetical protein [Treponema sp.]
MRIFASERRAVLFKTECRSYVEPLLIKRLAATSRDDPARFKPATLKPPLSLHKTPVFYIMSRMTG